MSYRFCFGASGSGKSSALHGMLLERADRAIKKGDLTRENYVILVPDQYSMQTQKEIVSRSPQKGILNIDVLSFGRLTHKIFEEIGVPRRAALDETGKTLLLRRVAGTCAPSLSIADQYCGKDAQPSAQAAIKSAAPRTGAILKFAPNQ